MPAGPEKYARVGATSADGTSHDRIDIAGATSRHLLRALKPHGTFSGRPTSHERNEMPKGTASI